MLIVQTVWKSFWRFIIAVLGAELVFLLWYTSLNLGGGIYFPENLYGPYTLIREVYFYSFLSMAAALGYLFNSVQPRSWLRQLPLSGWSLSLFPQSILLGSAFIVYFAHHKIWTVAHYEYGMSFSLNFILLPLILFYFTRRCRRFWMGVLLGSLAVEVFAYIWGTLFSDWSRYQVLLMPELVVSLLAVAMALFLEKEKKILALPLLAAILAFWGGQLIYRNTRTPQDLQTAAADLRFFPTARTLGMFQRLATTPHLWKDQPEIFWSDPEAYVLFRDAGYLSNEYLTTDQRILEIGLIIQHKRNFELQDPKIQRFYSYPYVPYNTADEQPIQDFMLKNWQDNAFFCLSTPRLLNENYIKQIFKGPCPVQAKDLLYYYSPVRNRPVDHWIKAALLSAHTEASTEVKGAISSVFWPFSKDGGSDLSSLDSHWFELHDLTPDDFDQWNKTFLLPQRQKIEEMLNRSYAQYLKELWDLPGKTREEVYRTERLLRYLEAQIDDPLSPERGGHSLNYYIQKIVNPATWNSYSYLKKFYLSQPDQWKKAQGLRGKLL